jgi:hypothetical protein
MTSGRCGTPRIVQSTTSSSTHTFFARDLPRALSAAAPPRPSRRSLNKDLPRPWSGRKEGGGYRFDLTLLGSVTPCVFAGVASLPGSAGRGHRRDAAPKHAVRSTALLRHIQSQDAQYSATIPPSTN